MTRPFTILITGGIGSGKSAVCRYLEERGIPVYDSDSRAKRLYDTDAALVSAIADEFGNDVLDTDGRILRNVLASKVFGVGRESALHRLESIVHPAVLRDFQIWRSRQDRQAVGLESAIGLSLRSFLAEVDFTVLITAPAEERIRRAAKRDIVEYDVIRQRIASQESAHPALREPDMVIENDLGMKELYSQVETIIDKLTFCKSSNS